MRLTQIPDFELTKGQKKLVEAVVEWYRYESTPEFVYDGPAGTGKTSVLPFIARELNLSEEEILLCAFTGKAASVLMQKGFNATTIHSAFFELVEEPKLDNGSKVKRYGREETELKFREKSFINPAIKLIIVDEFSMVNEDLAHAIYKHGIPILACGDSCQLQPIIGTSPFTNKVRFSLTEITRQASYSGIIQLATMIREGEKLPRYLNCRDDAKIWPKNRICDEDLLRADMILTVKNKTRNDFNDRIRKLNGSYGKLPGLRDKLICRKNNWYLSLDDIPLINGTIGKLYAPINRDQCDLKKNIFTMDFQPDYAWGSYDYYDSIQCDYEYLNQPCGKKEIDWYNRGLKFEYAEAITVALSQGSQYGDVIYYDEVCFDEETMRKTRYTACTRAVNHFLMYI